MGLVMADPTVDAPIRVQSESLVRCIHEKLKALLQAAESYERIRKRTDARCDATDSARSRLRLSFIRACDALDPGNRPLSEQEIGKVVLVKAPLVFQFPWGLTCCPSIHFHGAEAILGVENAWRLLRPDIGLGDRSGDGLTKPTDLGRPGWVEKLREIIADLESWKSAFEPPPNGPPTPAVVNHDDLSAKSVESRETRKRKAADGKPTPGAHAIAAAYELQKEGKPVSLNAVCKRAGVDRGNLRRNYPEAIQIIKTLGSPDRSPRRGVRDHRTGDIDGVDDDED